MKVAKKMPVKTGCGLLFVRKQKMMKKSVSFVFSLVCLLALTEAAVKKPKYFNIYNELVGSWNVSKTIVSISTGEIIQEAVPLKYNFTKADIPNELLLEELTNDLKDVKRKRYQITLAVKDNFTAAVSRFEPGAENEVMDLMNIHFNEFLHEEVFVGFVIVLHCVVCFWFHEE